MPLLIEDGHPGRGRLGGGNRRGRLAAEGDLGTALARRWSRELCATCQSEPHAVVERITIDGVGVDVRPRGASSNLLSNLLGNALAHGNARSARDSRCIDRRRALRHGGIRTRGAPIDARDLHRVFRALLASRRPASRAADSGSASISARRSLRRMAARSKSLLRRRRARASSRGCLCAADPRVALQGARALAAGALRASPCR